MNGQFDYWGLLAGIALFLFAMAQLESGLKTLGGRSLAFYLKRQADRRINSVIGGIVSTALLQSSSVVGLMVLAFTGAGLLNLTTALGIVFGSNLGTTLTGWIVATIGFKFEIFELSLPLIGLGGLSFLFGRGRVAEYGRTVLSLGLLLLGLQLMKTSVESIEQLIDITDLAGLAPWQYLLFGTAVAAIIQSSSATMIITLAALHAGIIDLPNAAAVAIGADLGTTTTVAIGALRGSPTKKQVAAGHVIFNVVTDIIAFALRTPLLALIAFAGIEDPLYALVAFHSLFNMLGLIIFVPLTGSFARRLEQLFPVRERFEASYLGEVSSGVSEAAVDAIERETSLLIARAVRLNMAPFDPPLQAPAGNPPVPHQRGIEAQSARPFDELYRAAKTLEGELVEFTIRLQAAPLDTADSERLGQLLSAAREAMHSAKAIKDIHHNLIEFQNSGSEAADLYLHRFREWMSNFIGDIYGLREENTNRVSFEDLVSVLQNTYKRHDAIHEDIYTDVRNDEIAQTLVSSLLNVNRELLTSNRALLLALGDYYLDTTAAEDLERIPV
ncbi:MAG: Na/Pi symporter [Gammaproteobacteria bacterium]|jgi:phosphate:Na+ symporter|nr:Na/Pi symporter [Gammaproteobacteria bacterium]MDP6696094.1 Na/Pi symporter [Gammaproteobacteria bacterium]